MRQTKDKLPPHYTCARCGRHRLATSIQVSSVAREGIVCADGCQPRDCRCKDPHCGAGVCEVCHVGEPSLFQRILGELTVTAHNPRPTPAIIDHIGVLSYHYRPRTK